MNMQSKIDIIFTVSETECELEDNYLSDLVLNISEISPDLLILNGFTSSLENKSQ